MKKATKKERSKLLNSIQRGKVKFTRESDGCMPSFKPVNALTAPIKHLNITQAWDWNGNKNVPPNRGIEISWGIEGFGFGTISISQRKETGEIVIDNECMTPEFIERILKELVSRATLKWPREPKETIQ